MKGLGKIVDPINIHPIHLTNMNVFWDPLELLGSQLIIVGN